MAARGILRRAPVAGLLLLAALVPARAGAAEGPAIAAAADLQFALIEVARAFTAETGKRVRIAFGSSGNFARQIRQGAPFELFLSADERYVRALARDGLTRGDGALYALGRIVIAVPRGGPVRADAALDDLARALGDGRLRRFAIANPEHAPYGKRAAEALRHRGLWAAIRPRLVLGENVSQAAQFALSGATEGGLIAYSLALAPPLARRGSFALIPRAWHSPLRQRMVLLKTAGPVAARFYAFLREAPARRVLRRFGFALPGEERQDARRRGATTGPDR